MRASVRMPSEHWRWNYPFEETTLGDSVRHRSNTPQRWSLPVSVIACTICGLVSRVHPAVAGVPSTPTPPPAPVLVIQSIDGPDVGTIGGQINISVGVANTGAADAAAFSVVFYYSSDDVITSDDVYSGYVCPFNGLAAGETTGCGGAIGVPDFLMPGTYYLGAIISYNGINGDAKAASQALTLAAPTPTPMPTSTPPTPNAACDMPTAIPVEGGTFVGSTSGASTLIGSCGGFNAPEAVFQWVPSLTGVADISTYGSDFDTVLYIRSGDCSAGAESDCNDNDACPFTSETCGFGPSRIQPFVTAGNTYFIVVDGAELFSGGGAAGNFTLNVAPPGTAARAYVANSFSNTISIIDTVARRVV